RERPFDVLAGDVVAGPARGEPHDDVGEQARHPGGLPGGEDLQTAGDQAKDVVFRPPAEFCSDPGVATFVTLHGERERAPRLKNGQPRLWAALLLSPPDDRS